MKHTLNILIILMLTGVVSAQPGGGRPGGGRPGGERPGGERPSRPGEPQRVMPISLRIGLIETLGRIGGADAEAILVRTLKQTQVGVEVSLIDRQLTKLADGAEHPYKDKVLSAAKYILRNPPDAANDIPGQLDMRAVGALWDILVRYKDTTFKDDAEKMLVTEEGLNRRALDYLTRVLEAQSVPILATAYYDANIKDSTKNDLWGRINDYLDESPAAGTVMVDRFKDGLQKMATEAAEKAKRDAERAAGGNTQGGGNRGGFDFRSMMGGGRGGGARNELVRDLTRLGEGKDLTAEAINNRRGILTSIKATTNDENFQTMFVSVEKRLDELANPTEETSSRFRISDPQEAARREEMRKRLETLRNGGGGGGEGRPTAPRTPGGGN
ncbi:MAG: hypothetical protein H8E27_08175 [Verrucomicrobia subdivision 3 bacterium]|nr:hypothetical protein [Limisphaerales bacterium]